jgi:hypothetical protein
LAFARASPTVFAVAHRALWRLHATLLNFGLSVVDIDRIEMGMTGHKAPYELLSDVVRAGVGVELDGIGGFGLYTADDVANWDDKGVVTARANSRCVIAAGHRGAEE